MRTFLFFSLSLLMTMSSMAQSKNDFWKLTVESPQLKSEEKLQTPDHYQVFELEVDALRTTLKAAPAEWTNAARSQSFKLTLPLPNGQTETFAIWESSVMSPILAAKFPEIKSYKGQGIDDPFKVVRFAVGPTGFRGAIRTLEGRVFIDPYSKGQTEVYMTYYTKDHNPVQESFDCGFDSNDLEQMGLENTTPSNTDPIIAQEEGAPVDIYLYRLALACTAEFAAIHGGTVMGAMEAMNDGVNRLTLLYEAEMAIRFQLVDNNDELIFIDPLNQPYVNTSNGGGLLAQNFVVLTEIIGSPNYDIGHVFTAACGGGLGGIASGPVCSSNKARGVTCHSSSNVQGIVLEIMAHEVAHQFSAGHTWNHCPGNDGQYAAGSAFEPGSGSTIMSYSGSCGSANNVQNSSDEYFHVGSLNQMYFYSRSGNGSNCPTILDTDNDAPDMSVPDGDFYIPLSTPFELVAEASDPNNDPISYCWEQYNLGPYAPLGQPLLNGPSFRSYLPTEAPNRIFPILQNIVNNVSNIREVLPTYKRNLKFRCTVRDNNPTIGGVVWDEISFEVDDQSGPFLVTFPDQATTLEVGAFEEITWDVANTDNNLVNCQTVNILLSLDGGYTYPIVLEEGVANDGAQFVSIPDQETSMARIKVEAAENIFFDISNNNFSIVSSITPGYSLQVAPTDLLVCPPEIIEIDLISGSLLGFSNPITFQVGNLPAGATAEFTSNNVMPGTDSKLLLDLTNVTEFGPTSIEIEANADETDAVTRTVQLNIINNDFSALTLMEPANGTNGSGQLPSFTWTATPNADFYVVEVATDPNFVTSTIAETGVVNDGTSFFLSSQLETGTVYYWRVLPGNICGEGAGTDAFVFKTATVSCQTYETENVVMNISAAGLPEVISELNIPSGGTISDLNVTFLEGEHDIVRHIDVKLRSPQGTEVILFSDLLCATSAFDLGFDDDAPLDIPCPPIGNVFIPQDDDGLAKFNGENSEGNWFMKVKVINQAGSGGELNDFGLEICSDAAVSGPELINNNVLLVPPGAQNWIKTAELLSEDVQSGPADLVYTVISKPKYGSLRKGGELLWVGKTFTQKAIDDLAIYYEHDGSNNNETDSFTFTVSDPDGGWLGTPTFQIEIDENVTVSIDDLDFKHQVQVYPNPTNDQLNIRFEQTMDSEIAVVLYNIHGQQMMAKSLNRIVANEEIQLYTEKLTNGVYLLRVEHEGQTIIKKVTVQK